MSETVNVKETLDAIRSVFRSDIINSNKILNRKSCKDPEWHKLRIKVREEDVIALTSAMAAEDEIKNLRCQNVKLREALIPFAKLCSGGPRPNPDVVGETLVKLYDWAVIARDVLEETK